jgi:preprotein translocase subunit SecE
MNRLGKYVNAMFIVAGSLAWFVTQHYVSVVIGYFQLSRTLGSTGSDVIQHALPLVVGVLTFVGLRSWQQSQVFTTDALAELVRVNWPSKKDVRLGTIVVMLTVVVCSILFGLLDFAFTSLVRVLVGT